MSNRRRLIKTLLSWLRALKQQEEAGDPDIDIVIEDMPDDAADDIVGPVPVSPSVSWDLITPMHQHNALIRGVTNARLFEGARVHEDPAWIEKISQVGATLGRWPGGTSAMDYWGDEPKEQRWEKQLAQFAENSGIREYIYVMNVLDTPRAVVDSIQRLKDAGLNITRVQYGNELHLKGKKHDYRKALGRDAIETAKACVPFYEAVSTVFPNMKFCWHLANALAIKDTEQVGRGEFYHQWNTDSAEVIKNGILHVDACSFHLYGYIDNEPHNCVARPTVAEQYDCCVDYTRQRNAEWIGENVIKYYRDLGITRPLWNTEWNVHDHVFFNTIWSAGFVLGHLLNLDRLDVELATYHQLWSSRADALVVQHNGEFKHMTEGLIFKWMADTLGGGADVIAAEWKINGIEADQLQLQGYRAASGKQFIFFINRTAAPIALPKECEMTAIYGAEPWASNGPALWEMREPYGDPHRIISLESVKRDQIPPWGVGYLAV